MKNTYIKIVSIIVGLSLVFFITIGIGLLKNKKNFDYIVINDKLIIRKKNNRWNIIRKNLNKYSWNFYSVYIDHEYFGRDYLYFNDQIYLFDKDKMALNYNGDFIAFNNKEYKDINYEIKNSTEKNMLASILKKNGLDNNQNYTSNYYIDIDIDNDGKNEQLYVVSNRFPIDNVNAKKYFGFIYLVDDNKVNILYKNVSNTTDGFSGCKPYIRNIINNNNSYYIITGCATYSDGATNLSLYEYKSGAFDKKISTVY